MHAISLGCVAALGLLLFGLGLVVSTLRFRQQSLSGHSSEPTDLLHRVIRAHGNTAEYAGFLAVLFLYLGANSPSASVLWLMVAVTVCRFLIVAGLIYPASMNTPNPLRFVGALGTYFFGVALCVALVSGA